MDFEQIVRWYFAGEKAEAFWILAAGVASLLRRSCCGSWRASRSRAGSPWRC